MDRLDASHRKASHRFLTANPCCCPTHLRGQLAPVPPKVQHLHARLEGILRAYTLHSTPWLAPRGVAPAVVGARARLPAGCRLELPKAPVLVVKHAWHPARPVVEL